MVGDLRLVNRFFRGANLSCSLSTTISRTEGAVRYPMLLALPKPVLTVATDVLRDLDGDESLTSLWFCEFSCYRQGSLMSGLA